MSMAKWLNHFDSGPIFIRAFSLGSVLVLSVRQLPKFSVPSAAGVAAAVAVSAKRRLRISDLAKSFPKDPPSFRQKPVLEMVWYKEHGRTCDIAVKNSWQLVFHHLRSEYVLSVATVPFVAMPKRSRRCLRFSASVWSTVGERASKTVPKNQEPSGNIKMNQEQYMT